MTAERSARSTWLLVCSTPLCAANVHSAGDRRVDRALGERAPLRAAAMSLVTGPATRSATHLRRLDEDSACGRERGALEWRSSASHPHCVVLAARSSRSVPRLV